RKPRARPRRRPRERPRGRADASRSCEDGADIENGHETAPMIWMAQNCARANLRPTESSALSCARDFTTLELGPPLPQRAQQQFSMHWIGERKDGLFALIQLPERPSDIILRLEDGSLRPRPQPGDSRRSRHLRQPLLRQVRTIAPSRLK